MNTRGGGLYIRRWNGPPFVEDSDGQFVLYDAHKELIERHKAAFIRMGSTRTSSYLARELPGMRMNALRNDFVQKSGRPTAFRTAFWTQMRLIYEKGRRDEGKAILKSQKSSGG